MNKMWKIYLNKYFSNIKEKKIQNNLKNYLLYLFKLLKKTQFLYNGI